MGIGFVTEAGNAQWKTFKKRQKFYCKSACYKGALKNSSLIFAKSNLLLLPLRSLINSRSG
jgi:hypothetical protein